jgi:hypothetical protein
MIGRRSADLIKASGHARRTKGRMDGSSQDRYAEPLNENPCGAGGVHGWMDLTADGAPHSDTGSVTPAEFGLPSAATFAPRGEGDN